MNYSKKQTGNVCMKMIQNTKEKKTDQKWRVNERSKSEKLLIKSTTLSIDFNLSLPFQL